MLNGSEQRGNRPFPAPRFAPYASKSELDRLTVLSVCLIQRGKNAAYTDLYELCIDSSLLIKNSLASPGISTGVYGLGTKASSPSNIVQMARKFMNLLTQRDV